MQLDGNASPMLVQMYRGWQGDKYPSEEMMLLPDCDPDVSDMTSIAPWICMKQGMRSWQVRAD